MDRSEPPALIHHRYRLKAPLGQGGMGATYLVEDRLLGRDLALKLVSGGSPRLIAAFRSEFTTLGGLLHPNLCQVHDFGCLRRSTGDMQMYFTSEYIDGDTMDRFVVSRSWSEVLGPLVDTLEALRFLHDVGIRHGDIKPQNILVDKTGHGVVIDLGCCRPLGAIGGEGQDISGTPGFMAPELLRGEAGDHRSDLFAFGVTLRELVRHLSGGDVPISVARLIERLVAEIPRDRPTDVAAVLEALGIAGQALAAPRRLQPTQLIGRENEATLAMEVLETLAVERPGPRALILTGPEGIGRSQLLREMKWIAQQQCQVVEGSPREGHLPVTAMLRRATGRDDLGGDLASALSARSMLANGDEPVVLIFDDVHLIDETQRGVLYGLLRTLEPRDRMAVLCAELTTPDIESEAVRVLSLDTLTEVEVASWVGESLPPSRLVDVMRLTGGFPVALQSLMTQLGAGDFTEDDLAVLAGGAPLSERRLESLSALDESEGRALGFLAASGRNLAREQLAALDVKAETLSSLLRAGWIQREPDGTFRLIRVGEASELLTALGEALSNLCHLDLAEVLRLGLKPPGEGGEKTAPPGQSECRARLIYHLASGGRVDEATHWLVGGDDVGQFYEGSWPRAVDAVFERRRTPEIALAAAMIHEASGHAERAIDVLLVGLDVTPAGDGTRWRLHQQLGVCHLKLGDAGKALIHLERAEESLDPTCDHRDRPAVLDLISRAHIKRGDYGAALDVAHRALDGVDDGVVRADLEHDLGVAASYLGDFETARVHLSRAAALHSEAGHPRALYRASSYEALNEYRAGDAKAAITGYERALDIAEAQGLGDEIATAALNLGAAAHQLGLLARALRSYERGLPMATALGKVSTEATLLCNAVKLHGELGLFDRASALANRAEQVAERAGLHIVLGIVDGFRGELLLDQGNLNEARVVIERGRRTFAQERAPREVAELDLQLAEVALAEKSSHDAESSLGDAQKTADELDVDDLSARTRLISGRIHAAQGRYDDALAAFERAAELAHRVQQPGLQAEIDLAQSMAHLAQGSNSLAKRHRRRARELWEASAAGLPPHVREAFWAHPRRRAVAEIDRGEAPVTSHRELRLEQLLAINRKLNSSLKTKDVLSATMDAAIELTNAERGFLLVVPVEGGGPLQVAVARNLDREKLGRSHLKFSRTIAEHVVHSGEPVVTVDAQSDERFSSRGGESIHAMRLKSVVSVPIRAPSGILGAIYLDNRFQSGLFEGHDLELLMAFADQVALALTNARLVDELEQRTLELEEKSDRIETLAKGQAHRIDSLVKEVRTRQEVLEHRYDYSNIIGRSPAMQAVFDVLDRIIDSTVTVLIQGESGTGKELIARTIHFNGPRREGPFVAINCGALPEGLLESELFGHRRGAFTGADRDKEGLLVAARGGSLFLDELGEMPPGMQVKLLRVLEQREVRPLGSTRDIPIDLRLICATNRRLQDEVEAGRFREDLFYRLGVVELTIPPLRARYEDVPELARHFLDRLAKEHHRPRLDPSQGALRTLLTYEWPGNVRQLENVLTKALLLAAGEFIEEVDLSLPDLPVVAKTGPTDRKSYQREEGTRILAALRAERWNVSKVAQILGMSRPTLYRKMKRLGLSRQRQGG